MLEQSEFLLEIRSLLIKRWKDYRLEGTPSGLTYRMRQSPLGRSDRNRMVALWFHDDPEKPSIVAKWGTAPGAGAFTLQEYRHAKWLHESKALDFIPRAIDCPTLSGIPVLIEEAVVGRSFAHRLLRFPQGQAFELKRIFSKSNELLKKIQDPLQPVALTEFLNRFEPYFSRAASVLGWTAEEAENLRAAMREKMMNPVPGSGKTLLAGDFAPQHLIESEHGIFLIDLEFSLESVMAFLDPLTFAYRVFRLLSSEISRQEPEEAVRTFETFFKGESGAPAFAFFEARNISKDCLAWYWIVFFIHEALFQHFILERFDAGDAAFYTAFIRHFAKEPVKK